MSLKPTEGHKAGLVCADKRLIAERLLSKIKKSCRLSGRS
jgi:hypothetical protein